MTDFRFVDLFPVRRLLQHQPQRSTYITPAPANANEPDPSVPISQILAKQYAPL